MLRARGLLTPLVRPGGDATAPLEIGHDSSAEPELHIATTDIGWGVVDNRFGLRSLNSYGTAEETSLRGRELSLVVRRGEPDLNEFGELDSLLSDPLVAVTGSILKFSQTINLRRGDMLPIGSQQFPLPYQQLKTVCLVMVNESGEFVVEPHCESEIDGAQIFTKTIIRPCDNPIKISGPGWLVTASFFRDSLSGQYD